MQQTNKCCNPFSLCAYKIQPNLSFAFQVNHINKLLPVVKKEYSFFASIPAGVTLGVNTLKGYVSQMKYLFSKEGTKQLGGFGTIGSIFPATWDWYQFWYMTAFLSIILAFILICSALS